MVIMLNNISTSLLSLLLLSTSIHPATSMDLDENPNTLNTSSQPLPQSSEPLDNKGNIGNASLPENTSNDANSPYEGSAEIKTEESGNSNSKKRKDRDNSSANPDKDSNPNKKKRKIRSNTAQTNNHGLQTIHYPPIPYPRLNYSDNRSVQKVEKWLEKNIIRNQEAIETTLLDALVNNRPWVQVMLVNLSKIDDTTKKKIVFNVLSKALTINNNSARQIIVDFFEIFIPHRKTLISDLLVPELKKKTIYARMMLRDYPGGNNRNESDILRYLISQGLRLNISWVNEKCIELMKMEQCANIIPTNVYCNQIVAGNILAKQTFTNFVQSNNDVDNEAAVRLFANGFLLGYPWFQKTFNDFMESTNPNERIVAEKVLHNEYHLKHPWAVEKLTDLLKNNNVDDTRLIMEVLSTEYSNAEYKDTFKTKVFTFSNSDDINEQAVAAMTIADLLHHGDDTVDGIYYYLQISKKPNEQSTYYLINSMIENTNASLPEDRRTILNIFSMRKNFKKMLKTSSGYNSDEDGDFDLTNSYIKLTEVNGQVNNAEVSTPSLDINTYPYPTGDFSNPQPHLGNGFNVDMNSSAPQNFAHGQPYGMNNAPAFNTVYPYQTNGFSNPQPHLGNIPTFNINSNTALTTNPKKKSDQIEDIDVTNLSVLNSNTYENFYETSNFSYTQVDNINNSSNTNNNMIPQVPYTTPLFNETKKNADADDIDACNEIGRMYEEGLECPSNIEQAFAYYKKAISLSSGVRAQLIDVQNQLTNALQENERLTRELNNRKQ